MKKILATSLVALMLTSITGAVIPSNVEAAHQSTGRRIERNVKRTIKNRVVNEVNSKVRRAVNRIFKLTDPNSRESMELRASNYLRAIAPGETVIFTGNSRMLSIIKNKIKQHPSQLYSYEQAITQSGKRINAIYVHHFHSIEDRIQNG
ncbi:MAG: hypothetical protein IJ223_00540 [Clostridia bacterium]|nr:hypothetical protein [Clostridia bacterium]